MKLIFSIVSALFSVLLFNVNVNLACNPDALNVNDTAAQEAWEYYVKFFPNPKKREHFTPTPEQAAQYGRWLIRHLYDEDKKKEDISVAHKDWTLESGKPELGVETLPPWAYIQGGGKAFFCTHPPTYGPCNMDYQRWGFNTFTSTCEKYSWSGCGGTLNNFVNLKICEKTCKFQTRGECEDNSPNYIEEVLKYNLWSGDSQDIYFDDD